MESAKSLATCNKPQLAGDGAGEVGGMYLSDTADVLNAILRRETQVFVQAEADVVAVESVGLQAEVEEVLLKGGCNGRFARGGEAGEPDGASLLLAEIAALLAGEALVPCDVAVEALEGHFGGVEVGWFFDEHWTYVAIVKDWVEVGMYRKLGSSKTVNCELSNNSRLSSTSYLETAVKHSELISLG